MDNQPPYRLFRDITKFSIAPVDEGLYMAVTTKAAPSTARWSFFFDLDITDIEGTERDFQIGIFSLNRENYLKITGPHNEEIRTDIPEVYYKSAEILEIYIPWSYLKEIASEKSPGFSDAFANRSYCRVKAFTWNNDNNVKVDTAPALASYKLLEKFNPMMNPPKKIIDPIAINFPFEEQWFLRPGPYQIETHDWEYDLHIRDQFNERKTSNDISDYYTWNKPVYSPVNGRIVRVVNDTSDNQPGFIPDNAGVNNGTWIDYDNVILALVHMKQNSVAVDKNQVVQRGQLLGYSGNSGHSGSPHIHIGAYSKKSSSVTKPLLFKDVKVGINTWENDPWILNYNVWLARNAYTVERQ